jgi:UDP-GlcNAc:undecaprenyl-phosphate GlcNAc-1-phosphate transferase
MAYPFLAFVLVLVSMPLFIRLAHRFQWFDVPDATRKTHSRKVPFTGGFSIFFAFAASVTVMWFVDGLTILRTEHSHFVPMYLYVLEAGTITFLLGVIDDFRELSFTRKFLFQFFAALFIVLGAIKSNFFPVVFNIVESSVLLNSAGTFVTVLWLVGTTNAINMIDGMDGLAGGTSLMSAVSMGFLATTWGNTILALVLFTLAGALLGFLAFNRHPARVFMGDTGSMFLGFLLGVCGWMLVDSAPVRITTFAIPVLLLGLPVLDTLLAFFRRLIKRKNPFSADTFHIHHMLKLRFGLSDPATVLVLYGASLIFSLSGVAIAFIPDAAGIALVAVLVVAVTASLHLLGYTRLLFPDRAAAGLLDAVRVKSNGVHANGNGVHSPAYAEKNAPAGTSSAGSAGTGLQRT